MNSFVTYTLCIAYRLPYLLFAVFVFGVTQNVLAVDLYDDFEEAASNQGCDSIPYDSQRSDCKSINSDMKSQCERPVIDCSALLTRKKKLIEKIDPAVKEVEKLENKKEPLIRERDRHSDEGQIKSFNKKIANVDEEIEDQQKLVDKLRDDLRRFNDRENVDDGINQAKHCMNLRGGSRDLFHDVLDDVRDVENDPEDYLDSDASDDRKKELREYADKVIDHIESEEERHFKAEKEYENWVANCEIVEDLGS